jgi:hypothetical protein
MSDLLADSWLGHIQVLTRLTTKLGNRRRSVSWELPEANRRPSAAAPGSA